MKAESNYGELMNYEKNSIWMHKGVLQDLQASKMMVKLSQDRLVFKEFFYSATQDWTITGLWSP